MRHLPGALLVVSLERHFKTNAASAGRTTRFFDIPGIEDGIDGSDDRRDWTDDGTVPDSALP